MRDENSNLNCGIVAIVGRPNVGKSSLLNYIIQEKVAIVSKVPQTTRFIVRGILNDKRGQVVFVDTPGLHLAKDRLGKYMNVTAKSAQEGVDLVLHLVDSSKPVGPEENMIAKNLAHIKTHLILGLNKIDLGAKFTTQYIELYERIKGKPIAQLVDSITVLPLSSLKGTNVDKLLDVIFLKLPKSPAYYPPDITRDEPQNIYIADIIREKLFACMRQEVPHSLAVLVEEIKQRPNNLVYVKASILIERDSQRKIIIGKDGSVLKSAGTKARQELEEYFSKKVYLDLSVKTQEKWRQDPGVLKLLGYSP
ncbi:MAG: GTPase Era [Candidatus Omnitrophota bacterium]